MNERELEDRRNKIHEEKRKLKIELDLIAEEQELASIKQTIRDARNKSSPLHKWLKRLQEKFGRY